MRAVLRVALAFLVVTVIAGLAAWFADRPGAIAVDWLGYRIETSVGVVIAALVVLLGLLVAITRLALWVLRSPGFIQSHRVAARRRSGEIALIRGLVAVAAGDAADARKQAIRAESAAEGSPLSLLLAAQAAQLSGDLEAAGRAYRLMLEDDETRFLGLRGLIVLARRRGDDQEALSLAREAQGLRPGAPWVASEIFGLQAALGAWTAAEETLVGALRHKLIDAGQGRRARAVVLLGRAREAAAAGQLRDALGHAESAHNLAPDFVPGVVAAATLLARLGKLRRGEKMIEAAWEEAPHPDLAAAFGALVPDESPDDRAARMGRLAARQPDHPESRLLAVERALARHDWAKARAILELLVAEPVVPRRAFQAYARLEQLERGDERRARGWADKAATCPMGERWVCRSCGDVPAQWAPHCPECRSFDSLEWRQPDQVTEIIAPPPGPADGTLAELPAPQRV